MGIIRLKKLSYRTCHGFRAEEKHIPQTFEVDVEMCLDLSSSGKSDLLDDTVDYSSVISLVDRVMMGPPRNLIENLAHRIAADIIQVFPVEWTLVRIRKPEAAVQGAFNSFDGPEVEVRLEREDR